jgi:hypothetical protein
MKILGWRVSTTLTTTFIVQQTTKKLQKKNASPSGGKRWQGMQHKEEATTRVVERETRLELATPTLARLCSTN